MFVSEGSSEPMIHGSILIIKNTFYFTLQLTPKILCNSLLVIFIKFSIAYTSCVPHKHHGGVGDPELFLCCYRLVEEDKEKNSIFPKSSI
jgi:hypothetical protein